jgi:hypothetical protein
LPDAANINKCVLPRTTDTWSRNETFKHSDTKGSKQQYEGVVLVGEPYVSVDMFFVPSRNKRAPPSVLYETF